MQNCLHGFVAAIVLLSLDTSPVVAQADDTVRWIRIRSSPSESRSNFTVEHSGLPLPVFRLIQTGFRDEQLIPIRNMRATIRRAGLEQEIRLLGSNANVQKLSFATIEQGRMLNDVDQQDRRTVCLISNRIANTLFPFEQAVGSLVRINRDYYQVVGILAPGKEGLFRGDDVLIPLSTMLVRCGTRQVEVRSGQYEVRECGISDLWVQTNRPAEDQTELQRFLKREAPEIDFRIETE